MKVKKLILIGDKVLVRPTKHSGKTKSGLYLPPGVKQKDEIQKGTVEEVGPGYALPSTEIKEDWKPEHNNVEYLPLQVQVGDEILFLQKNAFEIMYENQKYFIVPHHSILMIEREQEFFDDL